MSSRPAKLNVRPIPGDDEHPPIILVQGDQKALEWLGNLLIEHAKGNSGCGRQIYPKGQGHLFCRWGSTFIDSLAITLRRTRKKLPDENFTNGTPERVCQRHNSGDFP